MKKNIKNDLLRRAMIAFNCKKVNELAILLDVTPQNLNGYLDRGTFIKLIEGISYERGISIDWIITGQGSMHITGIKEAVAPYGVVALSNNTPAQSKPLLELTADVLSTDSVYRSALESNVKAFHDAVEARKQLAISEGPSSARRLKPESSKPLRRTCCGIPSPRTCWPEKKTCGQFKSC